MFILVPEFLCFFTLNLCLLPRSANGRWPWIQRCRVDKNFKIQVGNLKIKSFYKVSHSKLRVFKWFSWQFKAKYTFLNDKRKTNPDYLLDIFFHIQSFCSNKKKKTFSSKVAQFHDDIVYQSCHSSQMLVQKIVKYVVYVNHYGYDTPKVVHLLLSVAITIDKCF